MQCLFNFRIKKETNIFKASQKFVYEFRERVQFSLQVCSGCQIELLK